MNHDRRQISATAALAALVCASLIAGPAPSAPLPASTTAAAPPVSPIQAEPTAFPLHVDPGKRFLRDSNGKPFMILGDTPWSLEAAVSPTDTAQYLDDRKARGFNTILLQLMEHRFAPHAPYDLAGNAPFSGTIPNARGSHCVDTVIHDCWDFSKPNEAYWTRIDALLRAANARGFLVLLCPAYLGYDGGNQGWYQDMVANGPQVLAGFGRYLAARYRLFPNLMWVQGGDYDPSDHSVVDAIANGIHDVTPQALQTAHTARGQTALEVWGGGFWRTLRGTTPWLNVDTIYTSYDVYDSAVKQHRAAKMPFFLIETIYEKRSPLYPNAPFATPAQVRSQAYQAILGGAFGQLIGNDLLWYFPEGWQGQLSSPGARSMTPLHELMSQRAWWTLEPDEDVVRTPRSSGDPPAAFAAVAADRSFGLVYRSAAATHFEIDMTRLAGPRVAARWYDPTSGAYSEIAGSPFANSATRAFEPPGNNSFGDGDWVLVLDSTH